MAKPNFAALGLTIPDLLLPKDGVDLTRWAVVAADQYTSQRDYWQRVDDYVGDAPSTLRLILPEVYLEDDDVDARVSGIQQAMQQYLQQGVFRSAQAMVYIDRKTSHVASRKGLIVALDLEHYDYRKGSKTLVRATEKTVEERLPPRVKIRANAALELPHVMVLIDDPERTVIEPLAERFSQSAPLYDVELMENGGRLRAHEVSDNGALEAIRSALESLAQQSKFREKYGVQGDDVLLYAMGDGNHSLAAAKAHWDQVKKTLSPTEREEHPARHAIVELVNVHDEGLVFEPIHRVVFGVDPRALLDGAPAYFEKRGSRCSTESVSDAASQKRKLETLWTSGERHAIGYVTSSDRGILFVDDPRHNLAVGSLQNFLDDELGGRKGVSTDYIHGDDVVESLSADPERIGFYLPSMDKSDLFKTVILDGALPRKTFSMGEADEKRFYFEARKIVG